MIFLDPYFRQYDPVFAHLAVWNARNLRKEYKDAPVCEDAGHYATSDGDLIIRDYAPWVQQMTFEIIGKPEILEYWPTDGRSPTERPDLNLSPAYWDGRLARALEFLCGYEIALASHVYRSIPLDKDGKMAGKKIIAWSELERFIVRMEYAGCSIEETQGAITPILARLYCEAAEWAKVIPFCEYRPPKFDRPVWRTFGNRWRLGCDDRYLTITGSPAPMKLAAYLARLKPAIDVICISAGDTAGFLRKRPADDDKEAYDVMWSAVRYAAELLADYIRPEREMDVSFLALPWFSGYYGIVGRKLHPDVTVRNLRKHLERHNLFLSS